MLHGPAFLVFILACPAHPTYVIVDQESDVLRSYDNRVFKSFRSSFVYHHMSRLSETTMQICEFSASPAAATTTTTTADNNNININTGGYDDDDASAAAAAAVKSSASVGAGAKRVGHGLACRRRPRSGDDNNNESNSNMNHSDVGGDESSGSGDGSDEEYVESSGREESNGDDDESSDDSDEFNICLFTCETFELIAILHVKGHMTVKTLIKLWQLLKGCKKSMITVLFMVTLEA